MCVFPDRTQTSFAANGCSEPILQDCCVAAIVCYGNEIELARWWATLRRTRIISNAQRYATLIGAAFVALGFTPVPLTDPSLPKATWLEWLIVALPLMPLTILGLSLVSRWRMPKALAAVLALVFLSAGTFATIVIAAMSGGGAKIFLLHGVALTLTCATTILLVSTIGQKARSVVFGVYMFPVLVGVWSLTVVPLAYSSAVDISSNRAFCIGEHSPIERELGSIVGLRGLSFYTTRSGYKIGDDWFFHGVLLVEEDGGLDVYNWSPNNMGFQLVERPQLLFASPFHACQPKNRFLQELDVI